MLIFLSWARFGPQFEDGMKRKRKAEKRCPGPRKEGYEEIVFYVRFLKHCQEMVETLSCLNVNACRVFYSGDHAEQIVSFSIPTQCNLGEWGSCDAYC